MPNFLIGLLKIYGFGSLPKVFVVVACFFDFLFDHLFVFVRMKRQSFATFYIITSGGKSSLLFDTLSTLNF